MEKNSCVLGETGFRRQIFGFEEIGGKARKKEKDREGGRGNLSP